MSLSALRTSATLEEYALWRAYELAHGFWWQRIEAAIALSGSAACQTWGGKVKPRDLIPDFTPAERVEYRRGAEIFAAMARAHNERQGR